MAASQVTACTDMPVCEMLRSGKKDLHFSLIPRELGIYFVFLLRPEKSRSCGKTV
jgi:hypothetical protein